MNKSLAAINEIVRSQKHHFRNIDNQPGKAQKHRYERRKIREFLRPIDWNETEIDIESA